MSEFGTEVEAWLLKDGPLRSEPQDAYPGRCAGEIIRKNGSEAAPGDYCQRVAGWGTDHTGYGRCRHHGGDRFAKGLPPWVGEISPEEYRRVTGGREKPSAVTHGANQLTRWKKTWHQWIEDFLPEEEVAVFNSIPTDPVTIIDQEIKFNRLMAARIHRYLKDQRMREYMDPRLGGHVRSLEVQQAEHQLVKISGALARLMEVRARFSELASKEQAGDYLSEMMNQLSDQEFKALSGNPGALLSLVGGKPGVNEA